MNTIKFDIKGDPPWINIWSPLPEVKDSVIIDAFSQPNDSVFIDGSHAPPETDGLVLDGQRITVKGLHIGNFDGDGIHIRGSALHTVGYNEIYGCRIGRIYAMDEIADNNGQGIMIEGSKHNIIGGPEEWQRNYISYNNQCGIFLTGSRHNYIINNLVGSTSFDPEDGNLVCGVMIDDLSDSNYVGGGADSGNVISGNRGDGVGIYRSASNVVCGNNICDNANGIIIDQSGRRNTLTNNIIGINETGLPDGNRHYGIQINTISESNVIGGSFETGNEITDNDSGGIKISWSDSTLIGGNYIGVDTGGTVAVGNHGCGVELEHCIGTIIGEKLVDISLVIGEGNLISGNDSAGIKVYDGCYGTVITSNKIGVAKDGMDPLPNYMGVTVYESPQTYIGHCGHFSEGFGNIISHNRKTGIILNTDSCSVVSNTIAGNGGGDNVPIGGDGVYIDGGQNQIGGWLLGNEFNLNFGAAVMVVDNVAHDNNGNTIEYNKMFNNTHGGIDLAPQGINVIDDLDLDEGPNTGQNAPRFISAVYTLNKYLLFKGVLNSKPNQTYHVMVYNADVCVEQYNLPNAGREWMFEDFVTTDGSGEVLIEFSEGPWNDPVPGSYVMSVTDGEGNTSEFSNCAMIWNQPDGVDLVVTKTDHADSVNVPDTMVYEFTVANMGSATANNVVMTDSLPPFVHYVADTSDHGPCQLLNGFLTCNLGIMMPFDEAHIKLVAVADSFGLVENTVVVSCSEIDVDPVSNTAIDSTISSEDYSDVDDERPILPDELTLMQNFPNPFNAGTRIAYSVPRSTHVTMVVYNILGQCIVTLVDRTHPAGKYEVFWDGTDEAGNAVASGVYLYHLRAGDEWQVRRMVLLK
jgi:uncharacterized repeat protein (TIGR01451 family)